MEEWKSQGEVNALRASLKTHASVKRDGTFAIIESSQIVPGDVVLLKGGMVVPADCVWVEGDEMQVDTSALTGESMPRKVPDKADHRVLLSGFVVRAGECLACVKSTGLKTEMGEAAALVHAASERDTQGNIRAHAALGPVILPRLYPSPSLAFSDKRAAMATGAGSFMKGGSMIFIYAVYRTCFLIAFCLFGFSQYIRRIRAQNHERL
jgi:hypothetical protein